MFFVIVLLCLEIIGIFGTCTSFSNRIEQKYQLFLLIFELPKSALHFLGSEESSYNG